MTRNKLTAHRRSAFTLVELLAALSLTALLTAGLAGSLRGLNAQRKITADKLADRPARRRFLAQLEREIAQANHLRAAPNRLVIVGFGSLDPSDSSNSHQPIEIEYAIETISNRSELVRRQRAVPQLNNQRRPAESILADVTTFQVSALEENGAKDGTAVWQGAIPPRVLVTLGGETAADAKTEEMLYVR
jgi:type II secretory pathway component PulJ